jgi:hypothetical protein
VETLRQSCASCLPQRAEVRHPVVVGDHGLAVDHERRRLDAEGSINDDRNDAGRALPFM